MQCGLVCHWAMKQLVLFFEAIKVRFNWTKVSALNFKTQAWAQVAFLFTTRFQLILPAQSQNVTQNRTDHRMHIMGIQICQINGWNNSFQNMCSINRQKLSVWPGKSILCKKKHLKNSYFCVHESELPDFGRTWTPNRWHQINFWGPPKTLGYSASN